MILLRKRGLAILGTAVLSAATVGVAPTTVASAAPRTLAAQGTPFATAQFAAYGTGSELALQAVSSGSTTLARVDQAFSANVASSGPLGGAINSPVTGALVMTDQTANNANAYGRGSGVEVGLGVSPAVANQIQLGIAEAHAAPPSGLITKTAIPLNIPGVITTGLLTGKAAAAYNASFCPVGQPLAYGEGDASAPTGVVGQSPPLVSGTGASGTQAAQTRTRTDLVANADGTFGISNTVQEIITPLTVNLGSAVTLAVTVQGDGPNSPFTLTTFNDGEGHSGNVLSNNDPVVKLDLIISGVTTNLANVKLSSLAAIINPLLGSGSALSTTLAALGVHLSIDVGTPPAATRSNVAYDLLAINASLGSSLTVANLRLGHVESQVALPGGPIECTVPVAKVANPASVTAGNTFQWAIAIPATSSSLSDATCDLTNIKATDKISINKGSPSFNIGAISNGGVYDPNTKTVTWSNLGTYHPGDPPIVVTIQATVPSNSASGVLQDTANVTAGLGNCNGGATGLATAIGAVQNAIVGGTVTLPAPAVVAAGGPALAATGTGPMLAWIAAGLLAVAEGTRRLLRRARRTE